MPGNRMEQDIRDEDPHNKLRDHRRDRLIYWHKVI